MAAAILSGRETEERGMTAHPSMNPPRQARSRTCPNQARASVRKRRNRLDRLVADAAEAVDRSMTVQQLRTTRYRQISHLRTPYEVHTASSYQESVVRRPSSDGYYDPWRIPSTYARL